MTSDSVWRSLIVGYRKKHAFTQADAAVRLRVSQQTISRWESGKQEPDPEAQTALRQELGILAMTTRESWIQRISLSAGREHLFERGWVCIAMSRKIADSELFMDSNLLGRMLSDVPFFADLAEALNKTGLFDGDTKLVRVQTDFDLGTRSVGRVFDMWPVLTGSDEILVHVIGYPCAASRHEAGRIGVRILDLVAYPADSLETGSRRRA